LGQREIAANVRGDLVGDDGAIAVVGEMPQLRLELVARHLVKVEHRQERAEASAEDKSRIAAGDEVETAAGLAASL